MLKLKRNLATPLYEQIADRLRQQIANGKLKAGAAIPPESALTTRFQVSRVTTRQALDVLVREGLIVRRQGKGTFVAPPKIQQDLHALRGFAEVMAQQGREQVMQVIEFGIVHADAPIARALRLAKGERVLRVKRRHLFRGDPIAFALIYIPQPFARMLTLDQVATTPIYTLLARHAQVEIKRATQIVRTLAADAATAKLLALPKAAPVMMIERTTYSQQEKPVEYIVFYHRGDRYELAVELYRDPKANVFRPMDNVAGVLPES
ncbi:MAG: GntR family transcriptional regulator [Chloroflexi bacterium]|nr:GntR family transcriptional regulator [Chloroflexota bacterium]